MIQWSGSPKKGGEKALALTAYCKKCSKDVPLGESCPFCGNSLGKNAGRAAWCLEHTPVRDWISWNSIARLLLPAEGAILLIVLLSEWLSGGSGALYRLFSSGLPLTLLGILALTAVLLFLIFLLQGRDLTDYIADQRGIHMQRYLPDPTPLKLLVRGKAPSLMKEAGTTGNGTRVLLLEKRELAWKDVARVQLWPEKCMMLFYAPAWWLRLAIVCTPFSWEDCMALIREKLGKKKTVSIPEYLRIQPEKKIRKAASEPIREIADAIEQIRMEDLADLPQNEETDTDFPVPEASQGE